jgi:hypothetical protein
MKMSTSIKDLDGLPQGEIRELVKDGDRAVMDALGGEIRAMEERLGKVETRLEAIERRQETTEKLAQEGVDLGRQSVAQGVEILKRFAALEGEVQETRHVTADGVQVVTRLTRWGQTAKDFHLDKAIRWAGLMFCSWGAVRISGWLFGSEIRNAILHKLFGN